ncbi:MAG: CPBP family intramembrane metalloprotease [Myxococcales bacterium]|nr:CPBP family intramembrane metalloprotease [Myxococcales bacterium]
MDGELPLPPGLPPLTRPERLLWWQGAVAMVVAVLLLVIANLAVAAAFLIQQVGLAGLGGLVNDQERLTAALASFPLLAVGQVANLTVFIVIAVMAPIAARVPHRSALGLGGAPPSAFLLAALGILGLGPLADRVVTELKPLLPEQSSLEMIEQAIHGQPLWLLVPFLAVMPAVGEELLCRGVLQRSIRSPAVALTVSAVCFAALHMDPLHMAGVLPLGFYLAWLGHRTGSVWVPVGAHFTNNLAATLGIVFTTDAPADTAELPLWAVPVGLLVTAACAAGLHWRLRQVAPTPRAPATLA